ncbi:MAG: hypothetical protein OJF62_002077 [Pseudolabrys sp.]|jgi:hypothetical protein|nr:hypothetical protein [Pseudolabrys sp.]
MTSLRKIQANRANARRSRGPTTSRGRAHAARNAYRHGLSLPVMTDPALAEQVVLLAGVIAGPTDDATLKARAIAVAEAQVDLRRIRRARDAVAPDAAGGNVDDEAFKAEVAFERYERRAFSKFRTVLREFDRVRLEMIAQELAKRTQTTETDLAERSQILMSDQ